MGKIVLNLDEDIHDYFRHISIDTKIKIRTVVENWISKKHKEEKEKEE